MRFCKRRSVAPVIATLLMVAIAVVGGMLVFVFSQDFFTQTDSMTGPTIEQIQIYGYDARDLADSKIENHESVVCPVSGNVSGSLTEVDTIALYLRNHGNQPVLINEVNVFGTGATSLTGSSALAATNASEVPGAGEWTIVTIDTCVTGNTNLPIAIGDDATILLGWSTSAFRDVKVGRPVFISVETAAGNIFTKNLISGRSVG